MASSLQMSSGGGAAQAQFVPLLANDFDISKISFSDVRQLSTNGGKAVYVNYDGGKLVMQTPWVYTQFGVREPPVEYNDSKFPKYNMEISFENKGKGESNPMLEVFHQKMKEMDDALISAACDSANSFEWLRKKKLTKEICEALYTPQVRVSRNRDTGEPTDYPDTLKIKIPYYDGQFSCELFSSNHEQVDIPINEAIVGRTHVRGLIQCVGLWFAGGKFGCSWKALQLEYRPSARLVGYGFRDDGSKQETVPVKEDGEFDEDEEEEDVVDSDVEE